MTLRTVPELHMLTQMCTPSSRRRALPFGIVPRLRISTHTCAPRCLLSMRPVFYRRAVSLRSMPGLHKLTQMCMPRFRGMRPAVVRVPAVGRPPRVCQTLVSDVSSDCALNKAFGPARVYAARRSVTTRPDPTRPGLSGHFGHPGSRTAPGRFGAVALRELCPILGPARPSTDRRVSPGRPGPLGVSLLAPAPAPTRLDQRLQPHGL